MFKENKPNIPAVEYCIKVKGKLDENWSDWFDGLTIQFENGDPPITVLSGTITDQAKLRSVLNKLWDLNLTLVSVNILKTNDIWHY